MGINEVKNNTNYQHNEEEIVKSLNLLSINKSDKRALLRTTLHKIDIEQSAARSDTHVLLQNTEDSARSNHPTSIQPASNSWFALKFKIYAPLTAVVLVMAIGGVILTRRQPVTNTASTSLVSSNSSVEAATTALIADVAEEDTINQELISEGQTASQDLVTATEQIGDISNDTSF